VFLRLFSALSGEIKTWIGTIFPEEPKFLLFRFSLSLIPPLSVS